MRKRRRRGFLDVGRASGRSIVRRYQDPTVAEEIQRLKVIRDDQLGRQAARHAQEVRDLAERHARERRSIWGVFDKAKNELLEKTETEELAA